MSSPAVLDDLFGQCARRAGSTCWERGATVCWSDVEIRHRLRTVTLCRDAPNVTDELAAGRLGVTQVRELSGPGANPCVGTEIADAYRPHPRLVTRRPVRHRQRRTGGDRHNLIEGGGDTVWRDDHGRWHHPTRRRRDHRGLTGAWTGRARWNRCRLVGVGTAWDVDG